MTSRIRILELIRDFGIEGGGGGASRFCLEVSQRLDPTRFEVGVCGLWDTGTSFAQERIAHLTERGTYAFTAARWEESNPYGSFVRAYCSLRAALKAQPVSILHSHSEFADIAVLLLKTLPSRPTILRTVHNGYRLEWKNRLLRRWLFSYFLYPFNFDLEIGVSQNIVDNLNRRLLARLLGKRARRVYNGIDLQRFTPTHSKVDERRLIPGIPPEARVIGSVGRLAEEKGYLFLLDAFARVLVLHPEAYLLLVGDGPLDMRLRAHAATLGIATKVVFVGSQQNIETIFAGLDLFVSSSLWEGLSTVILESMAAGTPVVATDIPGTREIVRDRQNGWLVPAADPIAMAEAINEALVNKAACETFAGRAKEYVKVFSIDALVADYERIYASLRLW
jgi:glycosyltransferase involved in cell wall biosynthesis